MKNKIFLFILLGLFLIASVSAAGVVSSGTNYTDGDYTVFTFTSNGYFNYTGTNNLTAEILIIGGGGGGGKQGSRGSAGGGAGGLIYANNTNISVGNYLVVVGLGGYNGTNGTSSSFYGMTANGGGAGGTEFVKGSAGGSGGGGGNYASGIGTATQTNQTPTGNTANSALGYGFNGGTGKDSKPYYGEGGGGGSTSVGSNGNETYGGTGGAGKTYSINGTSFCYAGGGGGGTQNGGTGGSAGCNAGIGAGTYAGGIGGNALNGTGGGGGGASGDGAHSYINNGGMGGSGIVIVRFNTADLGGETPAAGATNATITLVNPDNYQNFTVGNEVIFNVTVTDANPAGTIVNLTLYLDGALNQTNDTICTNCTYNFTLGIPIGKHNWSVIVYNNNTNVTTSATRELWIKDTSSCNVFFNASSPITYPNKFIAYTNCTSDYTLYINGTSISNGTSIDGAGYYNLSVVRTDQVNYTDIYDEQEFIINKYTTDLSIIGTTPIVYGTAGDYEGFGCPSEIECKLYRTKAGTSTEVSNPDNSVLAAGFYGYVYNTSGNSNYTADSVSAVIPSARLEVTTFDDGCSLFFNETSPLLYPKTFTVWSNCTTAFTLRRNNTEITNNSEQDLAVGTYNFSLQRTDITNYTTTYLDEYFTISDSTPPTINVTVPQTSNYVFFTNYTDGISGYFPYTSYFINWTTYGDNLDTCWFENISSLNSMIRVNETVTCNANATIVYPVSTGNTLRFYANDTYGNIVSAVRTNITNDMRIDRKEYSYINTTTQGNIVNFWMNVRKGQGDTLENVTLVFNNTDYPITDFSGTNFSTNVTIPEITGLTTYYWKFDFGEGFFNSTIYNITVDSPPVITINSPTTTSYLTSSSPNVTINFSVADNNFANATYNVNGTNMTVLTNETEVYLSRTTGTHLLEVWAYDENMLSDYEKVYFQVKNLNQLTPTYTSSIYETQGTSYIVNLTDLYNTNLSAVTLFVNGSSYTPTQSGYLWNYTRQSPTSYLGNVSLIWQLTYSGVNYNTTTYYQLINTINFGLCNATYTVPYLNLSFKDEATNISMNATIQSSTFVYYLGNGTANKTIYYSTSSNYTDYRFCFLPGNLTYYIYPSVSYKLGTDYPLRTWNPAATSYTNSTTNQTLFLLSTSTGSYVTFQVVNSADQPLSGVNVNATRLIDGITTVVAQGTTDNAGSIQFWLNPDYLHTFMFSKSGYTTFTTSLFPTEAEYTITLGGSSSSSGGTTTDYTRGIKLFVYPKSKELQNDTTYRFIFNMTSSYWDVDEYGFSLRLSNGTIIGTDTEVTEESGTSISYNVNNQSIIYMDYYYDIDGNYINKTVRWVVTNSLNTDWSIKTLVEDANTYMDSGLFGLDNFGRYIISFLLLFLVVGIVGYKYGVVSPFFMSVLTFAVVFFLDVITGILPAVRGVEHLLTYVAGLIALLVVVWDLTR